MKMFVQALPVNFQTMVIHQDGMTIYYPKIIGLQDATTEQKMNQLIFKRVERLAKRQYEEQDAQSFEEMIGTYEIKTNERNILSLTFTNYAFAPHFAHGLTLMDSLTFDIETGKNYALEDLFKKDSDAQAVLSKMIKKQVEERDIPLLNDFPVVSKDQYYYIADKALVIYYQAYEITPGYVRIPMFPISVYAIEELIKEEGLLGRMLESS